MFCLCRNTTHQPKTQQNQHSGSPCSENSTIPPKTEPSRHFQATLFVFPSLQTKSRTPKAKGLCSQDFPEGVWSWLPPPGAVTSISRQGGRKGPELIPVPWDPAPQPGSLHQAPAPLHPPGATLTVGWARRTWLLLRTPKPPITGADPQHSPLQCGDLQDPVSSFTCSNVKADSCRPAHTELSKRLENSQRHSLPTCCLTAGGVSSSSIRYVSY